MAFRQPGADNPTTPPVIAVNRSLRTDALSSKSVAVEEPFAINIACASPNEKPRPMPPAPAAMGLITVEQTCAPARDSAKPEKTPIQTGYLGSNQCTRPSVA